MGVGEDTAPGAADVDRYDRVAAVPDDPLETAAESLGSKLLRNMLVKVRQSVREGQPLSGSLKPPAHPTLTPPFPMKKNRNGT